jgi:hypothetical protein
MNTLKFALLICAGIGIVFLILFAIAGFGSAESSAGHFLKDTFHGTDVEQSAASIEAAGNDLTSWANGAIAFCFGMLVLGGFMWVGANSKH